MNIKYFDFKVWCRLCIAHRNLHSTVLKKKPLRLVLGGPVNLTHGEEEIHRVVYPIFRSVSRTLNAQNSHERMGCGLYSR